MPKSNLPVPVDVVSFQGTELTLFTADGEIWILGSAIGEALGYAKPVRSISNIYKAHEDVLEPFQTVIESVTVTGKKPTRYFSKAGVYLLAMYASTERADAFKLWVVEVLEAVERGAFVPRAKYEAALKRAAAAEMCELKRRFKLSDRAVAKLVRYRNSGVARRDLCRIFGFGDTTLGKLLHVLANFGKVEVYPQPENLRKNSEQLRLEAGNERR